MRRIIGSLIGLICVSALFFACAENQDGSCNLWWSLGCIALAAICGIIWGKCFDIVPHIAQEVYDDLNKQIEEFARGQEDGYCEHAFSSNNVTIKVGIRNKTTQIKFKDDAWGNIKTFTETSWQSNIEVLEVMVYVENNKPTDNHDFDESYIETEYESTHQM